MSFSGSLRRVSRRRGSLKVFLAGHNAESARTATEGGPLGPRHHGITTGTRIAACALLVVIAACLFGVEPPSRPPTRVGVITARQDHKMFGPRILIEDKPGLPEGDKAWFAVREATILVLRDHGSWERGDTADLELGVIAEAWHNEDYLWIETYPGQGSATHVVVHPTRPMVGNSPSQATTMAACKTDYPEGGTRCCPLPVVRDGRSPPSASPGERKTHNAFLSAGG